MEFASSLIDNSFEYSIDSAVSSLRESNSLNNKLNYVFL